MEYKARIQKSVGIKDEQRQLMNEQENPIKQILVRYFPIAVAIFIFSLTGLMTMTLPKVSAFMLGMSILIIASFVLYRFYKKFFD